MQNDYNELYTLLGWAVPGGLGDRDHFTQYYEMPIKMGQKKDINETALGKVSFTITSAWTADIVTQLRLPA